MALTMIQWQTKINQLRKDHRAPIVLSGLLGLLLLWAIGNLINTIDVHKTTITAKAHLTAPLVQLGNLSDLHFFGAYTSNLPALPLTQLQLTLEGTMVNINNPSLSRALIASPSTPTKVYQAGDKLPGNATITRIATHYVVINDNGTLGKLALPIHTLTNGE